MQTAISHPALTAADAIAQAVTDAWGWYTTTFFSAEANRRYQVIDGH